jgi:hypothetical protein
MTIGLGNKIEAAEYIAIQSVIAPVLGGGSSQTGYGQSVRSAVTGVVQNSKITSSQWTNLRDDIVACRQHQTGITILDKTLGDPGYVALECLKIPTTSTTIKEQDRAAYLALANQCVTDKALVDPAQQSTFDILNPTGTTSNGIRTATWNISISHTITVTFPPTTEQLAAGYAQIDVARWFFNTGGKIQFSAARWDNLDKTGAGVAGSKNYSWNQLLTNSGTISFGGTTTTKSNTNGTITVGGTLGFFPMLASPPGTEFLQYVNALDNSNLYVPNEWRIFASVATNGTLTFRIVFTDLATVTGHDPVFGVDESVTGATFSFVKALHCTANPNVTVPVPVVSVQTAL